MESLVDSIVPLRPTLDEAVDLGESLSFRYTNVLESVSYM